jgi:hypothetical protein
VSGQHEHEHGGKDVQPDLPGQDVGQGVTETGQGRFTAGEGSGDDGEEIAAKDRDAGGVAELVDGAQDTAGRAGVTAGHVGQDDADQGRRRQTQAEAADEQRQSQGPVAGISRGTNRKNERSAEASNSTVFGRLCATATTNSTTCCTRISATVTGPSEKTARRNMPANRA